MVAANSSLNDAIFVRKINAWSVLGCIGVKAATATIAWAVKKVQHAGVERRCVATAIYVNAASARRAFVGTVPPNVKVVIIPCVRIAVIASFVSIATSVCVTNVLRKRLIRANNARTDIAVVVTLLNVNLVIRHFVGVASLPHVTFAKSLFVTNATIFCRHVPMMSVII